MILHRQSVEITVVGGAFNLFINNLLTKCFVCFIIYVSKLTNNGDTNYDKDRM